MRRVGHNPDYTVKKKRREGNQIMVKFKVGDKVVCLGESRTLTPKCYPKKGTAGKVVDVGSETCYVQWESGSTSDNDRWWISKSDIVLASSFNKIVITTDGEKTTARLYEGNTVVKSAEAKCSPEDTFDFATGAKIAYDRLMGVEEKKPEIPHEYKAGDKVRVIGNVCKHAYDIDDVLTLKGERKRRPPCFSESDDDFVWYVDEGYCYVTERDIEFVEHPSKFKVGDMVVGNRKANIYFITKAGYKGTVAEIKDGSIIISSPEFDNRPVFDVNPDCFDLYVEPEKKVELKEETKREPIKMYCIESDKRWFTEGKIYEIDADGHITFDSYQSGSVYDSFEDFIFRNGGWRENVVHLVKRPAKVDEWAYVTRSGYGSINVGEICKVVTVEYSGSVCLVDNDGKHPEGLFFCSNEYLVLDGYKPKTPEKELKKGTRLSDREARVGEEIYIKDSEHTEDVYKDGDVCKVVGIKNRGIGVYIKTPNGATHSCNVGTGTAFVGRSEYLVVEKDKPESEPESKPEYYNGKVVCVNSENDFITKGKVYNFVNGQTIDDEGDRMPLARAVRSIGELNEIMYSDFIEYKGE